MAHLGRRPTAYPRSALEWLYPRCANEACPELARLEIDHRHDWAHTRLNLVDWSDRLCPHDHDLKTRMGLRGALVAGTGRRALVPPDDPRHPANAGGGATASPVG